MAGHNHRVQCLSGCNSEHLWTTIANIITSDCYDGIAALYLPYDYESFQIEACRLQAFRRPDGAESACGCETGCPRWAEWQWEVFALRPHVELATSPWWVRKRVGS